MRAGFYIASYQVSLFPKGLEIPESKEVIVSLLNQYDGKPTIFPSNSEGTPDEVPVLNLKSQDSKRTCQIGKEKIGFTWLVEETDNLLSLEDILKTVEEVVGLVSGKSLSFSRVGFITTIAKAVNLDEKENIEVLEGSHLTLPDVSRMSQYQLKLTYDFALLSHPNCYQVLDIVNGKKLLDPEVSVLAVQQDLNTKPEEGVQFSFEKAKEIITEAHSHSTLDDVFDLVWTE